MKAFALAAAVALIPTAALAWGEDGHAIVAEIAQHRLNEQAANEITRLLQPKDKPVYDTPSLASFASWADDIWHENNAFKATAPWHYIDAPLHDTLTVTQKNCPDDNCVVKELDKLKTELRCAKTDEDKRNALRFAVHFVGDVHQPLHTVDEAQGGNQIMVHVLFGGDICNQSCLLHDEWQPLHNVWDTILIQKTYYNWGRYVTYLEEQVVKKPDIQADAATGGPLEWAQEAHAVAPKIWVDDGKSLLDGYYKMAKPIVDRQLALAGLRLARFLNEAYSSTAACP